MWDEQLRSARSKPSSGKSRTRGWLTRPPLAAGHLHRVDADHLTFRLKTPLSDGTTHLLLSPLELLEKLAGLIPPPRLNLVRYHGILAPNARHRPQVVPTPPSPAASTASAASALPAYPRRLGWAALLARVFALDVTVCPACGGRLRLIAALTEPASIQHYLQGVGLPIKPPQNGPRFIAITSCSRSVASLYHLDRKEHLPFNGVTPSPGGSQ